MAPQNTRAFGLGDTILFTKSPDAVYGRNYHNLTKGGEYLVRALHPVGTAVKLVIQDDRTQFVTVAAKHFELVEQNQDPVPAPIPAALEPIAVGALIRILRDEPNNAQVGKNAIMTVTRLHNDQGTVLATTEAGASWFINAEDYEVLPPEQANTAWTTEAIASTDFAQEGDEKHIYAPGTTVRLLGARADKDYPRLFRVDEKGYVNHPDGTMERAYKGEFELVTDTDPFLQGMRGTASRILAGIKVLDEAPARVLEELVEIDGVPLGTPKEIREAFMDTAMSAVIAHDAAEAIDKAVETAATNPVSDPVYRPHHYARYVIEPITFINANKLPYNIGNAIKYITRFDAKNGAEDIRKAIRYLEIQLETMDREERVKDGEDARYVWAESV